MLSFLAGVTSSARLLTSVMVLPHRSPVLAAKMIATADVLSGGRVILGCGVGWMREEFEAIGAPPYDERGAVGDEYIRVFKELWTSDDPSYEGEYAAFSDVVVPAQAGAEAASAHLDRRRESARAAPRRKPGRRLVSHRQQSAVPRGHRRAANGLHVARAQLRAGRGPGPR